MTKAENDPHKQDPAGLFETALAPGAQKAETVRLPTPPAAPAEDLQARPPVFTEAHSFV